MPIHARLLLIGCALLLPLTVVAQDAPSQDTYGAESGIYGVVMYVTEAGDFGENNDGSYTLTLRGVNNAAPYWLTVPTFMPLPPEIIGSTPAEDSNAVGTMLVAPTVTAWRYAEDLQVEGWLNTHDMTAHMWLYEPDYIAPTGELIFNVEVMELIGVESDKGDPEPPSSFRDGVLTVVLNDDVLLGLDVGFGFAIEQMRHTCNGNPRQLAICECKRDADDSSSTLEARYTAYAECNRLTTP